MHCPNRYFDHVACWGTLTSISSKPAPVWQEQPIPLSSLPKHVLTRMSRSHQSLPPFAPILFANKQSFWALHLQSPQPSQFGAPVILSCKLYSLTASPPASDSPGTTLSLQSQSWLQASTHPHPPIASSKIPLSSSQPQLQQLQRVLSHQPRPSARTVHRQRSQPQTLFLPSRV